MSQAWEAWEDGRLEEEFDPELFDEYHQLVKIKKMHRGRAAVRSKWLGAAQHGGCCCDAQW